MGLEPNALTFILTNTQCFFCYNKGQKQNICYFKRIHLLACSNQVSLVYSEKSWTMFGTIGQKKSAATNKNDTTKLIKTKLDLYHIHINVNQWIFKKRYNCLSIKTPTKISIFYISYQQNRQLSLDIHKMQRYSDCTSFKSNIISV